jgi:hypothetical protein
MTRRRWCYAIATMLVAATAVVGRLEYRALAAHGSAHATLATDHGSSASNGSSRLARRESRAATTPGGRVDIARVEAALARLQATTARFTPEQIADEQKRMAEAKARFESIKLPEPKTREFTDEQGIHWIELTYDSGEVRYQLAPTPADSQAPARTAR